MIYKYLGTGHNVDSLKSLRNKFLVIIMAIFLVVMAVAFAAVYFITYDNIQQDIRDLDITYYKEILSSLLYTMLAVGFILLTVIVTISIYFSNRAIKYIATAKERQRQFISDVSHELKTPITIIKSNLGLVMSSPDETVGNQTEWLNYVKIGADRMSKLVDDLLFIAIIDNADLQVEKEYFNISDTVFELAHAMAAKADESNIKIVTSIQSNITIHSDREKVMQIATILLDNAIKYSEPSESVIISLTRANQRVFLSVTNAGVGITKSEIPYIFDRFYRTDSSRNSDKEGYGLGLPIAKALADKLGGNLFVESDENEGTTFTFVL